MKVLTLNQRVPFITSRTYWKDFFTAFPFQATFKVTKIAQQLKKMPPGSFLQKSFEKTSRIMPQKANAFNADIIAFF